MFSEALNFLALTFPSGPEIVEALPIIISLIIIEGLLSVDNALAIAAMANHLPEKQKYVALKLGIIGAYVFRGLCLLFASHIIANPWLKIIGAAYLVHLMAAHLTHKEDEVGSPEAEGGGAARGLWMTVVGIELMDLSLSVDNVVAAVALSPKLWIVCTGVFIGILALRVLAGYCIKLIERFPILGDTAFVLIGYVGCLLLSELIFHIDVGALGKFVGIATIIAIAIFYEKSPAVRRTLSPVLKVLRLPLKPYSIFVGTILNVIFWPFRFLIGLFDKKRQATDSQA